MNFDKSEMVPVGNVENVRRMANILGCKVSSPTLKYLGLLLGSPYRCAAILDPLIVQIERRLAG